MRKYTTITLREEVVKELEGVKRKLDAKSIGEGGLSKLLRSSGARSRP